jgi:hypothetical protein
VDPLSRAALGGLRSAVSALLPPAPAPGLESSVNVLPRRMRPVGLGNLVGQQDDPAGQVLGRRLEAAVVVTVRAADANGLGDQVAEVAGALVGASPVDLRRSGIVRLSMEDHGGAPAAGAPPQRDVTFDVLYEHIQRPEETEGLIRRIPLGLDLGAGDAPGPLRPTMAFGEGSLTEFEVVDDVGAVTAAPSNWILNAAEERIEQLSAIRGGTFDPTANKPATYLVLRSTPNRPPVADFALTVLLRSESVLGIGLVFRWRDPDNFYFFLMNSRRGWRLLAKKVGGSFARLKTGGLDSTRGYEQGVSSLVRLTAVGPRLRVDIDGALALEGEDASLPAPGRVGLLSHGNDQSLFSSLGLTRL